MTDLASLNTKFKNKVARLLDENNFRVIKEKPEEIEFLRFDLGFTKPHLDKMGEDYMIDSLSASLLGFIQEFSKNESRYVFFSEVPEIVPYLLNDVTFCYNAKCRLGILRAINRYISND